jgi:hypothetical protein
MIDDIARLDQEIGIPETCYFSCPVCDKPYRIRYDASGRKIYDGKYDDYTCFIKEGRCRYCETALYLAYDADHLCILAYDAAAEERRRRYAARHDKRRRQMKKIKQLLKESPTAELRAKKSQLKQKLERLEMKMITRNEAYLQQCHQLMTARRLEDSVPF